MMRWWQWLLLLLLLLLLLTNVDRPIALERVRILGCVLVAWYFRPP